MPSDQGVSDELELLIPALMLSVGVGLCCYAVGAHAVRVEAVEHGHAMWKVDAEGTRTFRWNGELEPEGE